MTMREAWQGQSRAGVICIEVPRPDRTNGARATAPNIIFVHKQMLPLK